MLTVSFLWTPGAEILPDINLDSPPSRGLPTAVMVAFSGCLDIVSYLRRRRNRANKSTHAISPINGDLSRLNTEEHCSSCHVHACWARSSLESSAFSPSSSPTESYSPASSGALGSAAPSPTGHCRSPDGSGLRKTCGTLPSIPDSTDVYLCMHTLDNNESVLFVHKKLTPIKTRSEENHVPVRSFGGKSLLRTLMEQAEAARAAKPPIQNAALALQLPGRALPDAAVTATVTVVRKNDVCPRPALNLTAQDPFVRRPTLA
jgi:hypothetical protein